MQCPNICITKVVTLGDVINPTKFIEKPLLSPKLSTSDNSIIEVPLNPLIFNSLSEIQLNNGIKTRNYRKILNILNMNRLGNNFIVFQFKKLNSKIKLLNLIA